MPYLFLGRTFSELTLIKLAYGFEQATKFRTLPGFFGQWKKAPGSEQVMTAQSAKTNNTIVLTVLVIITNVVGNVSLSHGMHQVGQIVSASLLAYFRAAGNVWVITGVCVLCFSMIAYLALLSRADLSFVLPVTASGYVFIALAGHFLLHERVSWVRWAGIVIITLGTALVLETPARTTESPQEHAL